MEFEDIIYVLVVLVAVGAGILKRINNAFAKAVKQRPVQPTDADDDENADDDDDDDCPPHDWRKPVQNLNTESFPEVKYVATETPLFDEKEQVAENQSFVYDEQPKTPATPTHHHAPVVIEQPEESVEPIIDFSDMDEVKKAVVANEILQRKY
ncbi:MAG: hypothetical protein MSS84_06980 [Bacteroidales bacterium]|nr:hypothetical protein [Bacteroidales bacterium]